MKVDAILKGLLIISIIIVLLNEVILADVPEIFQKGDEIGNILSNLSLAYISSYIFYYVVVVLHEKRDKANLKSTIHFHNQRIVSSAKFSFETLKVGALKFSNDSKYYTWEGLTFLKLKELCDKTDPSEISQNRGSRKGLMEEESYGEVIYRVGVLNVDNEIDKLFQFMRFLSTDHIRILNSIRSCNLFWSTGPIFGSRGLVGNRTMTVWAQDLFEYIEAIKELEAFINNNKAKI